MLPHVFGADLGGGAVAGKPGGTVFPRGLALWMTAIYIGLFIIRPWEQLFPVLATFRFERVYGICLTACVVLGPGLRFAPTLQNWAVAAWTGAIGLCAALAWNTAVSGDDYYVFLTTVVCYLALVSSVRTPYALIFMVVAYVGAMEAYLGKALWEFYVHGQHMYDRGAGVVRLVGIESTFGNHNKLAASIVESLPFWLVLWHFRGTVTQDWPAKYRRAFVLAMGLYPILGVWSVILTNSRSGIVNLAVFLALSAMRKGNVLRLAWKVAATIAILAVGWLVLPDATRNRVQSLWDTTAGTEDDRESAEGRMQGFWVGLEMFSHRPLTGVGPGNFTQYRASHLDGAPFNAHNQVAQMLGESGVLGAGTFLIVVLSILVGCATTRSLARGAADPTLRFLSGLAVACCHSLVLLFVEGIGGHNYYRYNWLWLAAFSMLAAQFAAQIPGMRIGEPADDPRQQTLT